MAERTLTALVVDDEPLARAHLKQQLERQFVQVVGEAESAAEALQLAQDLSPDLLFLDIRMPGLSGMQCATMLLELEAATQIIFVTAYAEHAVDAFEQGVLDYLVKPVAPERLAATLARARDRMAEMEIRQKAEGIAPRGIGPDVRMRRLPIREEYAIRLIHIDEIVYAAARDKRVFVSTTRSEYRTFYTLAQLETLLPPEQFFRIHDAWLVNLDRIGELCFLGNHSYVVRLADKQQLPVSRYRCAELQRRLGIAEKP